MEDLVEIYAATPPLGGREARRCVSPVVTRLSFRDPGTLNYKRTLTVGGGKKWRCVIEPRLYKPAPGTAGRGAVWYRRFLLPLGRRGFGRPGKPLLA